MKKTMLLLLLAGALELPSTAKADAPCMSTDLINGMCIVSTTTPFFWPILTTGVSSLNWKQEAAQVINDSQEYFQTGNMSIFLSQKVNSIQNGNADLSAQDALDILILASAEALQ